MSMDIHTLVQNCLKRLQAINGRNPSSRLQDGLGRFRVWAGNVSAHRPASSRRSLEYRLRDSLYLRITVIKLLQDLQAALKALEALDGRDAVARTQQHVGAASAVASQPSSRQDQKLDGELNEEDMFELSDEEDPEDPSAVPKTAQLNRYCDEIDEIVACLFRFASALRKPAQLDRTKYGSSGIAKFYEPWAYEHVKEKFPHASPFLHKRVARNMSANKQYVSYRQSHHEKLVKGLDEALSTAGKPSTLATSLPEVNTIERVTLGGDQDDAESLGTATSYATTLNEATILRPPAWPEDGQDGRPFECPLCYCIITADSERSWRQHIFEDIAPYCCTQESCPDANKAFARRRDWVRHEGRLHRSQWECPYGCGTPPMTSASTFEAHVRAAHDAGVAQTTLNNMLESERRPDERTAISKCPFCSRELQSEKTYVSHVGRHYEQLALFTLPQHLLSTEDEPDDMTQAHADALEVASEDTEDTEGEGDEYTGKGVTYVTVQDISDAMNRQHNQNQDQSQESPSDSLQQLNNAGSGTDMGLRARMAPEQENSTAGGAKQPVTGPNTSKAETALESGLMRKRTKTGCLTCRKRRIKCGEERPVCKNCITSKRLCEGYYQRVVFKSSPHDVGRSLEPSLLTEESVQNEGELHGLQNPDERRGLLSSSEEGLHVLKPDAAQFVHNTPEAQEGIPPEARWTKIDRRLVNPEALDEAHETFEERQDAVIVLRALTKEEIQKFADRTREIRGKQVLLPSSCGDRSWESEGICFCANPYQSNAL